jgi:phosphotransferase family enzyme
MHPIEAAVALGTRHGLTPRRPTVLKDGSNLIVHLEPHPVVVRVATVTAWARVDPQPWLEREVRLTEALVAAGAHVVPPSPLIAPGPHEIGGWWMTALSAVEHDGVVPSATDSLAALDRLHELLAPLELELPVLGPAVEDLDLVWAALRRARLVDEAVIDDRRARRDRLVADLFATDPRVQPLHGDAFPRNSLVTRDGIAWIDFEEACLGPVAWDHAVLIRQGGDPGLEPVLRQRDGDAAIDATLGLRALQGEAWTIVHRARAAGGLPLPASFREADGG